MDKRLIPAILVFVATINVFAPAQQLFEGTVDVRVYDDFSAGKSKIVHYLVDDAKGTNRAMRLKGQDFSALVTGARVRVLGEVKEGEIVVDSRSKSAVQVLSSSAATDNRNIAVILVNFTDATLGCSAGDIAARIFPDGAQNGSNLCVSSFQCESSFGAIGFNPDADGDGAPDVFGPYTISATRASACDEDGWAYEADALATADGVDLSLYRHLLYVVPSSNSCTWGGIASLGCGTQCRAWVAYCTYPTLFAHELGHNLGMAHGALDSNNDGVNDDEYGDYSDVMGSSYIGWRHNNAPHKVKMGWFNTKPDAVLTVSQSGVYTISPLEVDPEFAAYPQVLRVYNPSTTSYYYLSFRINVGYDTSLRSTYANKVSVHRLRSDMRGSTYFITALADGQVFQDSALGFSARLLSHNADLASGNAQVEVSFGCAPQTPTLVVSPANATTNRIDTAVSYTVSITNRDSAGCTNTAFNVAAAGPSGWTVSVSPSSLTVAPGASATATLTCRPPATAADGSYSFNVQVTAANHAPASATATCTLDTTPPAAPASITAQLARKGGVTVSWTASSGAVSYAVYRNTGSGFALMATTAGTSWKDSNTRVSVDTTFSYCVRATDIAGNVSPASPTASVLVKAATGKPR